MKRKALLLSIPLALALGLSGCNVEVTTQEGSSTQEQEVEKEETKKENTKKETEPAEEEKVAEPTPLTVGETVQDDKFSVALTAAYASDILQSSESTTYWQPQDGAAFVVLEFDVTALTSDQLAVDGYALTDLLATYNGNTYQSWRLSYISSQLWMYFMNTYLEANLPCHVYAYTSVPADVLNGGPLTVDLNICGEPYKVTIQ